MVRGWDSFLGLAWDLGFGFWDLGFDMLKIPVLRWGQAYESLEVDEVVHFTTGEPIARVSRANGGLIQRDMRKAARAREALKAIPIDELIARAGKAGELYMDATLPIGDGTQTPDEFVRAQSASTGLPERMCRANMKKNAFVLAEMRNILASLTRGLSLDVLTRGYGEERSVPISFLAVSSVRLPCASNLFAHSRISTSGCCTGCMLRNTKHWRR